MKKVNAIFIFYFIGFILNSQNKFSKLIFNHFGKNDIIGEQVIRSMVKDNQGFLWFATSNGLYKYDGITYKAFKHNIKDTNSFETNSITSVIKDKQGMLWIGVDGAGLCSLNPITEKIVFYKNPFKSIVTKRIDYLKEDDNDNIYISTYGGGLSIFNKKTKNFKTLYHSESDTSSLAYNTVNNIVFDENGKVWICLKMKGIDLYDPISDKITHYDPFKGRSGAFYFSRIAKYKNDYLYISGTDGLLRFSLKERKFKQFLHDEKDENSITANAIRNLYVSTDNKIYLSFEEGKMDIFDHQSQKAKHFDHNADDLYSLSKSPLINSYYEDENGFIYLCKSYAGIDVVYPKIVDVDYYLSDPKNKNSLIRNDVMCLFLEDDRKLWIGNYGAGASCLDLETGILKNYYCIEKDKSSISNGLIYSFHKSKDGFIWFCTENGLNKIDPKTEKVVAKYFTSDNESKGEKYIRTNRLSKIYEDEKGNFWISLIGGGLLYFDTKTEDFSRYTRKEDDSLSISDNRIFDLAYDKTNNIIWLATYNGGLNAFDIKTKKVKRYQYKKSNVSSISNDNCLSVSIDSRTNILWIATEGGLNGLDLKTLPKNRDRAEFYHLTQNEGLPDDQVLAIVPDGKGRLWFSTERSICCFFPPKSLMGQLNDNEYPNGIIKVYNKSHGLPISSASSLAGVYSRYTRRLYFGDVGVCSFNPDAIRKNKKVSPVYITSIKLFDKPIETDTALYTHKSLNLLYDQNSISFSFSSPDFYFPENIKFAYTLEGFDKKWNNFGSKTSAEYTNLSPGYYTFRVKACNNDGYWSDVGAVVTIRIFPPFWKTNWFYTVIAMLLVGGTFLIVRIREKKLLKENAILEDKVIQRTKELFLEKEIVMKQRDLIGEKQKEIIDSINYAKRIQYTLLAHEDFLKENIPNHFVYFNPKDIVSGDFYWATKKNDKFYLAVCDSTGHGVPGAFMSLLNIGFLTEAINEKGLEKPNEVFNFVRQRLIENISKEGQKDGFDGVLICIDKVTKEVTYSAANNGPLLISNGKFSVCPNDRMPVGMGEKKEEFKLYNLDVKENEVLYLYTDGYADQFGGPRGKKFMYKKLNELLLAIHSSPIEKQKDELKKEFEIWRSDLEQVDDVCIIGIRL